MKRLSQLFLLGAFLLPCTGFGQLAQYWEDESKAYRFDENTEIAQATFFEHFATDLGLTERDEMRQYYYEQDAEDYIRQKHYKYVQYYDNIPVENTLFFLHSDTSDLLLLAHGDFVPNLSLSVEPNITVNEAIQAALDSIDAEEYAWEDSTLEADLQESTGNSNATYYPSPELIITSSSNTYDANDYHLAYKCEILTANPIQRFTVFVDAVSSEIIKVYHGGDDFSISEKTRMAATNDCEETENTDGILSENKIYSCNPHYNDAADTPYDGYQTFTTSTNGGSNKRLDDCNRFAAYKPDIFGYAYLIRDPNGYWPSNNSDVHGAAAFWGVGKIWEYFQNVHGRNGVDNNGKTIDIGWKMSGAAGFFDKKSSVKNINSASSISLATDCSAPDFLGHEFSHGVIAFSANIPGNTGTPENKAIQEGICDIFGEMIEKHIRGNTNWIIGNQISSLASTNAANRNFANPHATNPTPLPAVYQESGYWDFTTPSPDPHINAGVVDKWFYLISNGGTHNGQTVNGIGTDKGAKIVYRTVNNYFTSNLSFADFRYWTIQSTRDLYGWCSPEVREVSKAWEACGVGTTLYCATFGVSIKGALYCQEGSLTLYASHNLPNTPTYSWSASAGVSISNQIANHATFSNLKMPSTTMTVTINQSNPSISVYTSRTVGVTSCRLANPHLNSQSDIKIYPNPTENSLHIEVPNTGFDYTLLSYTGAKVQEGATAEKGITLNVTALTSGIYLLRVKTEKEVYTQKIEIIK